MSGVRYNLTGQQTVELSLIESLPLVGIVLGGIAGSVPIHQKYLDFTPREWTPARQTDVLVVSYSVLLLLLYLPRLPVHATVTVRYLLPAMPFVVYAIYRYSCIRAVIETQPRLLGWTYAAGVLLGGQLTLLGLVFIDPTLGEAVQLHALVHLGLAGGLTVWAWVATRRPGHLTRFGAILLGLTAAATSVFLLLAGSEYFVAIDQLALPLTRVLAEAIPLF